MAQYTVRNVYLCRAHHEGEIALKIPKAEVREASDYIEVFVSPADFAANDLLRAFMVPTGFSEEETSRFSKSEATEIGRVHGRPT